MKLTSLVDYPIWFAAMSRKLATASVSPNIVMANFNGTHGATTTTDNVAGTTHTLNAVSLSTAVKKYGSASADFDGPNTANDVVDFAEQTNITGCTVSFWIRYADVNPDVEILALSLRHVPNATASIYTQMALVDNAILTVDFYGTVGGNATVNTPNLTFLPDTWYHVAFVQNGADIAVYFNGTRQVTSTLDGGSTLLKPYESLLLAADGQVGHFWLDDLRVVNSALYTGASYTPPTSEQV